jgi:hypothetical protein
MNNYIINLQAIIALGPPPKKKLRRLDSEEMFDEKQENLDGDRHKADLHRRTKREEENLEEEENGLKNKIEFYKINFTIFE